MEPTLIRNVSQEFLARFSVDRPFISMGGFGCVMRARRITPEAEEVALKIQYVSPESGVNPVREFEFSRLSASVSQDPFTLEAHELYKIPLDALSPADLKLLISPQCKRLQEDILHEMVVRTPEEKHLSCAVYVTEMELASGTLATFLEGQMTPLTPQNVRCLSFAIAYHLFKLHTGAGIAHRDLHLRNILFKERDTTAVFVFRILNGHWEMHLGDDQLLVLPVIGDFGLAERVPHTSHEYNWRVSPLTFLLKQKPGQRERELMEDGFALDVWSFGLILLSLGMAHLPMRGIEPSVAGFRKENLTQRYDGVRAFLGEFYLLAEQNLQLLALAKELTQQLQPLLLAGGYESISDENPEEKDINTPSPKQLKVAALMLLCLLQKRLGNGFLPPLPKEERGPLYGLMRESETRIEHAFSLTGQSFMDTLLLSVREQLGPEGMRLLALCLQWEANKRTEIDGKKLFLGVLFHPYFTPLTHQQLVQQFETTEIREEGGDIL